MGNNFNDMNERIRNLYDGSTSNREIRRSVMTFEEKQKVRKTMAFLFLITMITTFVVIIIFLNPFEQLKKSNNINQDNKQENELVIGEIDLSNEIVKELNQLVELSIMDLYYIDVFGFFEKESITTSELSDELKMHLIEKSYPFIKLLTDKGLLNYVETCDKEGLIIMKEDFDKVVTKVLGPGVSITGNLNKTMHYRQITEVSNLLFKKNNDNYLITCEGVMKDAQLNKYPSHLLTKALKTNEGIELYYSVVFVKDNNIYKDYAMTELITEDKNSNYEIYSEQGSIYKYTFNMDDEKDYYLSKIELVK